VRPNTNAGGTKISILLVTTIPETIISTMEELVPFLISGGHSVAAMSSRGQWIHPQDVTEKFGIPYYTVDFTRVVSPLKDIKALFQTLRHLVALRPDVVHYSTPKAALVTALAAFLTRVPVRIYTIRGMTYAGKKRLATLLPILVERVTCLLSHRVLCVSNSNLSLCAALGVCPREKMSVIGAGSSHGVDAEGKFNPALLSREKIDRLRGELGLGDGAVVFGFVGRLVLDKGAEELLRAWREFSPGRRDAFLVLIGDGKEPRDRFIAHEGGGKPPPERVRFVPPTMNIASYYGIMDVLVLPSHREGFPNVVLEAGAMALPVITTDAPGCLDSVVDGKTGLVFPCGDAAELANRMEQLYVDPVLRATLGAAGRLRARENFKPQTICEELLRLYEGKA
jgi:glycosyltransferase involved in cell wall biosynthesis